MPRFEKGQRPFDKMLPIKTCHDIRLWRRCEECHQLGGKNSMLSSGKDAFWHGRCFAKRFGTERMLEMPREQLATLMLGDLGVRLMRSVVNGIDTAVTAGERDGR
jgi:hypothetical protein